MKNLLLITKLLLFPYIILTQSLIDPNLNKELVTKMDYEFISVIIELKDDFNIMDLKDELHENNIHIKQRASIICETMQLISKETQAPVLEIIEANQDDYKNLSPSWIINAIFLDAKKSLINKLSDHTNIKSIKQQQTKSDIIDYIEQDVHDQNSMITENGTEPGIEAINVRPLWEMGYTGKGLMVFNYDTGVWPSHPAFKNRFFANHYPMNQCWDVGLGLNSLHIILSLPKK